MQEPLKNKRFQNKILNSNNYYQITFLSYHISGPQYGPVIPVKEGMLMCIKFLIFQEGHRSQTTTFKIYLFTLPHQFFFLTASDIPALPTCLHFPWNFFSFIASM